jgi:uncharacterized glyoxalase superfamily protein PhnB
MRENRSMPVCTVIPVLGYPDVGAAIDWLCSTFGFSLRLRIANHRAQLNVGDGAIVVTEQSGPVSKDSQSVMVRVENVDSHHEHAVQHGARVLDPPADYPFGERQYVAEDFAGHRWTFSQSIADVDPKDWGGIPG